MRLFISKTYYFLTNLFSKYLKKRGTFRKHLLNSIYMIELSKRGGKK